MPSYPWAKSINLIADSTFLFSLSLTCSQRTRNSAARPAASLYFSHDCKFLHQAESLSSNWALLCCDISYEPTESPPHPPKNVKSTIQDETRTQSSTKLPTTPRLSLHYTEWSDSGGVLVRPCWRPWHENRDGFVTCFLFCDWLCRKEARMTVAYT